MIEVVATYPCPEQLITGLQFVSQALAGQLIGLEPLDDGIWSVVFGNTLLGRLDEKRQRIFG